MPYIIIVQWMSVDRDIKLQTCIIKQCLLCYIDDSAYNYMKHDCDNKALWFYKKEGNGSKTNTKCLGSDNTVELGVLKYLNSVVTIVTYM